MNFIVFPMASYSIQYAGKGKGKAKKKEIRPGIFILYIIVNLKAV